MGGALACATLALGIGGPVAKHGLAAPLAPAAQGLSVDELIQLKALGFTDAQLLAELRQAPAMPRVGAADVERLRAAGVGAELLTALQAGGANAPGAAADLDKAGVLALVAEGRQVGEVLEAMGRSQAAYSLTAAEAVELLRSGTPRAIVLALKGQPLTVAGVQSLTPDGLDAAAWSALLALLGAEAGALAASDALALVRAGVPNEVVAALRNGAAATPRGGAVGPPPAPGPVGDAGGPKRRNPALVAVTEPTAPGRYRHVGGDFELRFPSAWRVLRSVDNDSVTTWLTPDADTTNPDDLEFGVQVLAMPLPDSSAMQGKDAASLLEHMLPMIKQWEPGLAQVGGVDASRLGALAAAHTTFRGTTRTAAHRVTIDVHAAPAGDQMFFVATQALDGREAEHRAAFDSILADSTFGRARPERRDVSLEARHLVQAYRESVVSVVAESASGTSTGTGFFVTPDGYVLTNHHVIWDDKTKRPCDRFYVEWDESLKRRKTEAKLVDYEFELGAYARFHGTDVALLKVEGGPYVPMPLTPMTGVEAGDDVVTLGFPSRGILEGVSLTITTGVVTRLNRGPDGKVVTIYTDAAITHGSSGGPCVSRVTGGVIGLNTFGVDVVLDRGAARLNDLINYFGVVPIDHCFREFPLEVDLRIPRDGSTLDWFDAYALARKFAEAGSTRAAERLAGRVVALRPDLADSHWLQALGKYVAGIDLARKEGLGALLKELPAIVAGFEGVLRIDPTSAPALMMLTNIHLELGKLREAHGYAERAVAASPEDWQAHHLRGRVALAERELPVALQRAGRAKELSGSALPEPFLLAGRAHYENKAYDAGKGEFEAARRLHPASLDAHMGVAAYHDLQGRTDDAVAAYRAVLADFPENPTVLAAIGKALYAAKRFPESVREYQQALERYQAIGQTPPVDVLFNLGDAFLQQKETGSAANVLALLVSYYPSGEVAAQVHVQLASIWHGAEFHGLAGAHLRAAKAITEDPKTKAQLEGMQLAPLSLEEIERMLKLQYPLDVAYLLIRVSPLTFAVQSEDEVRRLHEQLGIPAPLIEAIITSNKEHGVQKGGGAGSLVGTWVTEGQLQDGTRYRVNITYTPDRFNAETYANGQLVQQAAGTYKVEQGVIVARTDQGFQERYPFEFRNGELVVQMPGVGVVSFKKAR